MSDDINDVPPPPDGELAQFYWRHTRTGEPTNAELARVRPLATGEPSDADVQRVREQVVSAAQKKQTPEKPARRSFFPPELLAVAAVVLLAVLVQLLYLAFKKPEPTTVESVGLVAVTAAYRAGDLEGAKRLAGSSCTDANCASVSAKLLRAMELSAKFETLSEVELEELAKLDEVLSGGVATELTEAIAKRRVNKGNGLAQQDFVTEKGDPGAMYAEARALDRENKRKEAMGLLEKCLAVDPKYADCLALRGKLVPPAEQLFNEANAFRKEKNFESAVIRAETCIRFYPLEAPCYRLLGSTHAAIATRDQSVSDMEKAKKYYRRFLEVAPPDDEYVPKVKVILDQVDDDDERPAPALDAANFHATMFQLGQQELAAGRPYDAARYFRKVIDTPNAPNDLVVKAQNELAELRVDARDLYLRGYQLKESAPDQAAKYFQQVVEMTPDDDETHQKAKSRLKDLQRDAPAPAQSSVVLKVGQKLTLKFPGLARVALGDPSVLDVRTLGGDQLQLVGVEPGTTTLLLWLTSGQRESRVVTVSK